jgi:DHA2 family multidrug resistance protein-like MFS transporter
VSVVVMLCCHRRCSAVSSRRWIFLAGAAVGPLVVGALLEYFWWGSAFLIGVPVMALLLAAGPFLLPEYRDPTSGRLDLASAAMSLAAVLAVIYGLKQAAADGLALPPILVIAAGSSGWHCGPQLCEGSFQ